MRQNPKKLLGILSLFLLSTTVVSPIFSMKYNKRLYKPRYGSYMDPIPQKRLWSNAIGVNFQSFLGLVDSNFIPMGIAISDTAYLTAKPNEKFLKGIFFRIEGYWNGKDYVHVDTISTTSNEFVTGVGGAIGFFTNLNLNNNILRAVKPSIGFKGQHMFHQYIYNYRSNNEIVYIDENNNLTEDSEILKRHTALIGITALSEFFFGNKDISVTAGVDFLLDLGLGQSKGTLQSKVDMNSLVFKLGVNFYFL